MAPVYKVAVIQMHPKVRCISLESGVLTNIALVADATGEEL